MASLKKWDKVLRLCARRGFINNVTSSGGQTQSVTYGPLGAELKRNLLNEWWYNVVTSTGNVYPMSSPTLSPSLSDGKSSVDCSAGLRTQLLSPDLCSNVTEQMMPSLPYGLAEVGKVYQKHPDSSRVAEAEMAVMKFLCPRAHCRQWSTKWQRRRLQWWETLAKNPENFVLQKKGDNDYHQFIQFNSPEDCRVLEEFSSETATPSSNHSQSESSPASISISTMIDQAVLALFFDSYTEKVDSTKTQVMLQLHFSLAPYKILVVSEERDCHRLDLYTRKLSEELRLAGMSTALSPVGSDLEDELLLHDEIGTPFRVIVGSATMETGTINVMDRDTGIEEQIGDTDILEHFKFLVHKSRMDNLISS